MDTPKGLQSERLCMLIPLGRSELGAVAYSSLLVINKNNFSNFEVSVFPRNNKALNNLELMAKPLY